MSNRKHDERSAALETADEQLLAEVTRLAVAERDATAALIAVLTELDERRLYLREGYPSLFTYCTQVLPLRRAQELLRHAIPTGDAAEIIERALQLLVEDLERRRCAATSLPRETARTGCPERGFLEFHHVEPFAAGGAATVEHIQLRCRAHNAYEGLLAFPADESGMVRERRATYGVERTRSGTSRGA